MCRKRDLNKRVDHLQERPLTNAYQDEKSDFEKLTLPFDQDIQSYK